LVILPAAGALETEADLVEHMDGEVS